MPKGNADCHIPSDKYREGWDRIFNKEEEPGSFGEVRPTARKMLNEGLEMLERENSGDDDDGAGDET